MADEDLMGLVSDTDPDAFEVIYDRHIGAAYSLARGRRSGHDPSLRRTCIQA